MRQLWGTLAYARVEIIAKTMLAFSSIENDKYRYKKYKLPL